MAQSHFRCGRAKLQFLEKTPIEGTTCSKEEALGYALRFLVSLPGNIQLQVAYAVWRTGERDVRCLEAQGASQELRRLEHGLRLGLYTGRLGDTLVPAGRVAAELRQARIRPSSTQPWSNLYKATLDELSEGAGVDVRAVLERFEGVRLGTRMALLSDFGPRADFWCLLSPTSNGWPPVVAYVLTRVLPLANGYTHLS